jgi:HlyD family secretion protein
MRHRIGRHWLGFVVGGAVALGTALLMLVADLDLLRRRVAQLASTPPQLQSPEPAQPRAVAIRSLPVRRSDLEQRIGLTGDIEAEVSVQVFSKVAGVLEELAVETGDYVHAGQLLGRIEWRELAARVDQAAALVKRYRAQYAQLEAGARPEELAQASDRVRKASAALEHAKRTLDRTQELVDRAFVPPQELDNAQSAYQTALAEYNIAQDNLTLVRKGARAEDRQAARAQLQEAEAMLRLAQVQLGYTTLTAPITGVIAERFADRGAFVTLTAPVLALIAMDRIKILGRVSERDLGALRVGQHAEVRVDAYPQELFRGEVRRINPTVDRTTRTVEIEISLDNPEHRLKPGMFAHVSLIVQTYRNVLLVPKVAVIRDGAGAKVFIRNERVAHARPVKTGFATDDWVIVLDRVQAGEEVVVAGQEHLTDGAPVIVVSDGGGAEGDKR